MTRKMKDSGIEWIGEIPEDWKLTKVKHIGKYINGYPFKPSDWSDSGVPIIRIQNLTGNNSEYNYYSGPKLPEDYFIIKNDYLISWSATLGVFIWHKDNGYLNQHIFKVVPNEAVINYNYFYWIAKIFIEEIQSYMHGSAMQHVTKAVFDNFTIPLPSVKQEQKKISTFLDKKTKQIEDIKNTISEEIENLENYKKSVITEAVTKGLDKNVEMKDSGIEWIGEIPKHWNVIPLKHICKITMGQSVNGSDILDEKKGYPFLQGCAEFTEYIPSPRYWSTKANKIIDRGSLLMSVRAPVGDVNIADQTYGIGRGLCAFNGINNKYIYYILISSNSGFLFYSNGTTYDAITVETLKNFKVAYSSINEQDEIVAYLDKKCTLVDSAISKKQKQLEVLEEYKKSLIYEYVTGKKEVKDGEES